MKVLSLCSFVTPSWSHSEPFACTQEGEKREAMTSQLVAFQSCFLYVQSFESDFSAYASHDNDLIGRQQVFKM